MVKRLGIGLCLGLCLLSPSSWGWGRIGHKVVATIAAHHLTPTAKQHVANLLDNKTMAQISNWPDEIRSRRDAMIKRTFAWHFATFKDHDHYQLPKKFGQGDLYTAITSMQAVLADPQAPPQSQRYALIFLIHLVADAHQPLHVGNVYDYGANQCFVHWLNWSDRVSLHRVWDTLLLQQLTKQAHVRASGFAKLIDHVSDAQLAEWQHSPVMQWLQESYALHQSVYPDGATLPSKRAYCHLPLYTHHLPHLRAVYLREHAFLVKQQLLKAGIRLAGMLNALYHV